MDIHCEFCRAASRYPDRRGQEEVAAGEDAGEAKRRNVICGFRQQKQPSGLQHLCLWQQVFFGIYHCFLSVTPTSFKMLTAVYVEHAIAQLQEPTSNHGTPEELSKQIFVWLIVQQSFVQKTIVLPTQSCQKDLRL